MVWWCGPAMLEESDNALRAKPKKHTLFYGSIWALGVGAIAVLHNKNP